MQPLICRRVAHVGLPLGLLLASLLSPASAQVATIRGTVTDSATAVPLVHVAVVLSTADGSAAARAVTGFDGTYQLLGVSSGRYTVAFTRIGYRHHTVPDLIASAAGMTLDVALVPVAARLEPVIVTAARSEQAALDAPASVSVVSRDEIEETIAVTPVDHVRDVTGIDFASKGIAQHTFATRGQRGSNSGALLVLHDYRYAALPSLRFNVPFLIPATSDDLDRIEVIRGPGAAIYGPDSDRGVLHLITRSPFDEPGPSFSIAGGERDLVNGTLRYAATVGEQVGLRVTGEYLRADDWETVDSVEVLAREGAIAAGADADTLRIGLRGSKLERASGQARLEWRPTPQTTVIGDAGFAQAFSGIDLTGVGATQVQDWRYTYYQARIHHGKLLANVLLDASESGDTYQLRTGLPIVDESRVIGAQIQHGVERGPVSLAYGVDARWTDPRTGGTIHGRNEQDDLIAEQGGYVSSTTALGSKLDLVAALRVDRHSRLDDYTLSPRLGFVFQPVPTHALRLTYNRAFDNPTTTELFVDILAGSLPAGLPYDIRAVAIPQNGFSFARDCDGLCMRTPFGADPDAFVPADATLTWPAVVAILGQQGVNISALPAPSAAQVTTNLGMLNPATRGFDPVVASDVADIPPLGREITNTFEAGYKGVVADRVVLGADVCLTRVSDVHGSLDVATPQVFYDRATLEAYLANFMPAAQAAQLAGVIAQIPVGTISPRETAYPTDVLLANGRGGGGQYTFWGVDLSLEAQLTDELLLRGTYSWMSKDSIAGVGGVPDFTMNAPRHKGSAALGYRHERLGLTAEARGRAVAAFPVSAGVLRGAVEDYVVLDLSVGYRFPWSRRLVLSVSAYNVTDNRHREYVGAPELGRLVISRLRAQF